MHKSSPARVRLGSLCLGASALLLTVFPLVRPFFPLDVFEPARTLDLGGSALASASWLIAHLGGMLGFALLPLGLLTLYFHVADGTAEPRTLRGLVMSMAGIALVMPAFGVETFSVPILARMYLAGATDVAPMLASTYRGPMTLVMLLGLLLLAIGAFDFAVAIRRDGRLPRWAGIVFALGLALWLPLLPRPIRVADGFLIGIGGGWLAWSMWQSLRAPAALPDVSDVSLP